MNIREFIENIGISYDKNNFYSKNNTHLLKLNDSDEFQAVYSLVSACDLCDLDTDKMDIDEHHADIHFTSDQGFDIFMFGDFDNDEYSFYVDEIVDKTKESEEVEEDE